MQTVSGKGLPVPLAYDSKKHDTFAQPVPNKGLDKDGKVDDDPAKVLVRDFDRLGCKKVNGKIYQYIFVNVILKVVNAAWKVEWVPGKDPR